MVLRIECGELSKQSGVIESRKHGSRILKEANLEDVSYLSVHKIKLLIISLVLEIERVSKARVISEYRAGEEESSCDEKEERKEKEYIPKEIHKAVALELVTEIGHAKGDDTKE